MPRAITHADFEAVFDDHVSKVIERFNTTGEQPPELYLIKLGALPGQIERRDSMHKVAIKAFESGDRNAYAQLIRELVTPGSLMRRMGAMMGAVVPDVVVQINEAWMASEIKPKDVDLDQWKKRERLAPSERPDRVEVILIAMHTLGHSTMGMCEICDKPKRHAVILERPEVDMIMTGRMSMTQDEEEFK